MKLKYYLRGLGIGIAVTALVLSFTGGGKTSLTDEEIMARARELGMVESVTLSQLPGENDSADVSEVNSANSSEDSGQDGTSENTPETSEAEEVSEPINEELTSEEISEETSEDISEETSENVSEPPSEEDIDEFVIVEVGPGDGSDTVSRKPEE